MKTNILKVCIYVIAPYLITSANASDPSLEIRSFSNPTNIVMIQFETWSGYRKVESVWVNSDATTNYPKVLIGTFNITNNVFSQIVELSGPDESNRYFPISELILEKDREYYARFEFRPETTFDWKVWVPRNPIYILPGFGKEMVSADEGLTWVTATELGYEFSTSLLLSQVPEITMTHNEPGVIKIDFVGVLQESSNLVSWTDIALSYESPLIINPEHSKMFYRSRTE